VKISYLCANTYIDPKVTGPASFPTPPVLHDREVGARGVEAALGHARLADELGFDWVSVSEHHFAPGIQTPNAIVFAGALTQVVKRSRIAILGPIVSINNPVRIAEEIALVDMLSGGRVVVFLLRGTPDEFRTYYFDPRESRERAQEAIKLIEHALTEPRPFGWEGRYFRFPTVSVWPRPAQDPHPPIFSSGNSPESCVFAARNHHGLAMSFIPPHLVARAVALYKSEAAKCGWEPAPDQIIYRSHCVVGETDEEVAEQAERTRRTMPGSRAREAQFTVPRGLGPLSWRDVPSDGGEATIGANGAAPDRSASAGEGAGLGSLQFFGGPDTLVEQIRRFHETTGVGVLDLLLAGSGGPDGMTRRIRIFANEVLPRVREIGATPATAQSAEKGAVGVAG
jgi:alkanesulfonate monooxygenase SsuD/methylene tetrahydromethanopterin reductase-like flavin-dependent oxidoreductase (luciferase family)